MASGYTDTACTKTRCSGIVDLAGIVVILLLQEQFFLLYLSITNLSLCRMHSNFQTALRNKRWPKPMACPHN